ncbi:hypothetical protein B0G69_7236 [Paraburkholderia sp. RAU2J]|nr:hypothetical protein B0G69_7236 [Paraburkholderia sp. RAU2J]
MKFALRIIWVNPEFWRQGPDRRLKFVDLKRLSRG